MVGSSTYGIIQYLRYDEPTAKDQEKSSARDVVSEFRLSPRRVGLLLKLGHAKLVLLVLRVLLRAELRIAQAEISQANSRLSALLLLLQPQTGVSFPRPSCCWACCAAIRFMAWNTG